MKVKGKHVILSFVLFVFGYMIAVGYQQAETMLTNTNDSEEDWDRAFYYRQQLIEFEEFNHQLEGEIHDLRLDLLEMESVLGEEQLNLQSAIETKQALQAYVGELAIEGEGVFVTLSDNNFIPTEDNVNYYIVHDRHVQMVINELYSAGAKAIQINGQRIYSDSHVFCVGPVITIDGNTYPAPFTIEAIGDQETLEKSMTLTNGLIDQLVNDQIEVEYGKLQTIEMQHK